MIVWSDSMCQVLPASAGMILMAATCLALLMSAPRIRGDDPRFTI